MNPPAGTSLRPLRYLGGKSAASSRGTGRWVAAHLPNDAYTYVEPCAGMSGVLLQRPPAKIEVVNDLDDHIVTWWRVVRDRPTDLAAMLEATPFSRAEYEQAGRVLQGDSSEVEDLQVAWAVSVALGQGFIPSLPPGGWRRPHPTVQAQPARSWSRVPDNLLPLARRMESVTLERGECADLVERFMVDETVLIYMDPPYASTAGYDAGFDAEPLLRLLGSSERRARVAISGGEWCPWDELGWRCTQMGVNTVVGGSGISGGVERVERLWLSFPPLEQQTLLLDGDV